MDPSVEITKDHETNLDGNETMMIEKTIQVHEDVHCSFTDEDTMVNIDIDKCTHVQETASLLVEDTSSTDVATDKSQVEDGIQPLVIAQTTSPIKTMLASWPRDKIEDGLVITTAITLTFMGTLGYTGYYVLVLLFILAHLVLPTASSTPFIPMMDLIKKHYTIHIPVPRIALQRDGMIPYKSVAMVLLVSVSIGRMLWPNREVSIGVIKEPIESSIPVVVEQVPMTASRTIENSIITTRTEQSIIITRTTDTSIITRTTDTMPTPSTLIPVSNRRFNASAHTLNPLVLIGPPSNWPFLPTISPMNSSYPPRIVLQGPSYVSWVVGQEFHDPGVSLQGHSIQLCQLVTHQDVDIHQPITGLYHIHYWFRCVSRNDLMEFDIETQQVSRLIDIQPGPIPSIKHVDMYQSFVIVEFKGVAVLEPHSNTLLQPHSFIITSLHPLLYQSSISRVQHVSTHSDHVEYVIYFHTTLTQPVPLHQTLNFTLGINSSACFNHVYPFDSCLDVTHNHIALYQPIQWHANVTQVESIVLQEQESLVLTLQLLFPIRMMNKKKTRLSVEDMSMYMTRMQASKEENGWFRWWSGNIVSDDPVLHVLSVQHDNKDQVDVYTVLASLDPGIQVQPNDTVWIELNEDVSNELGYSFPYTQSVSLVVGCNTHARVVQASPCDTIEECAVDCHACVTPTGSTESSTSSVSPTLSLVIPITTTALVPTPTLQPLVLPRFNDTHNMTLTVGSIIKDTRLDYTLDWNLTSVTGYDKGMTVVIQDSTPIIHALVEGVYTITYHFISTRKDHVQLVRCVHVLPKCPTLQLVELGPGYRTVLLQFSSPPSAVNASTTRPIPLAKDAFVAIARKKDGSLSKGIPRIKRIKALSVSTTTTSTRLGSLWARLGLSSRDPTTQQEMPSQYKLYLEWSGSWQEGDELVIGMADKDPHSIKRKSGSLSTTLSSNAGCFDSRPPYEKCSNKVIQLSLDIAPRLEYGHSIEYYGQYGLFWSPFSVISLHGWFSIQVPRYIWRKWILGVLRFTRYENELIVRVGFTHNITTLLTGISTDLSPHHFQAVVFRQKDEDLGQDVLVRRKLSYLGQFTLLPQLAAHKLLPSSWGYEHPFYRKKKSSLIVGPGSMKIVNMEQGECGVPQEGTPLTILRVEKVPLAPSPQQDAILHIKSKKKQMEAYQKMADLSVWHFYKLFIKRWFKHVWLSSLYWILGDDMEHVTSHNETVVQVEKPMSLYDVHLVLPLNEGSFSMGDLVLMNLVRRPLIWGVEGSRLPVQCNPLNLDIQHQLEASTIKRQEALALQQEEEQEKEWFDDPPVSRSLWVSLVSIMTFILTLLLMGGLWMGYVLNPVCPIPLFLRIWLFTLSMLMGSSWMTCDALLSSWSAYVYRIVSQEYIY